MEGCQAAVRACTESTVTLRVTTGAETGALIAVYASTAEARERSLEWREANVELATLRDQNTASIHARHAQGRPGPHQANHAELHLRIREDSRRQQRMSQVSRRLIELEGEITAANNHAFRLGPSAQHRTLYTAGTFACNLKYGLTWARRRLALAAMAHSRLWASPLNIDLTTCIANFLASRVKT